LLLLCSVNQAAVSIKRIEKFLLLGDIDPSNVQTDPNIGIVFKFLHSDFIAALYMPLSEDEIFFHKVGIFLTLRLIQINKFSMLCLFMCVL